MTAVNGQATAGRSATLAALPWPHRKQTAVLILIVLTATAAAAWAYIVLARGQFWRTDQRLPPLGTEPADWPRVTAVIPARDEAGALPASLPTLLRQEYPGPLTVVVTDDNSSDGTAAVAADLGTAAGWQVADTPAVDASLGTGAGGQIADEPGGAADRRLTILPGQPLPEGWAGKVWAMSQGVAAAGDTDYVLLTDADIAYAPGTLTKLVRSATAGGYDLVSQMARLHAEEPWERVLVPAFVYFFAQLYPFRLINRPGSRVAAAAGGCVLVRRGALATAGGLGQIRDARIDDVALGQLLKSSGGRCWLGLTEDVVSVRAYPRLRDNWDMVARSAYTQLRYSPARLAAALAGLAWMYLLPPAAVIAGVAAAAAGGGASAVALACVGAVAWIIMSLSYVPMLRFYGLSPLRAPSLPLITGLYAAMTADSARRHLAGRGGVWKGRTISR
jgi:hopene-associated glycosyltransferase HpnB